MQTSRQGYILHISLVRRAWNDPSSIGATILASALGSGDIKATFRSKTNLSTLLSSKYPTFRQVLLTWFKFHSTQPKTEEEVLTEALWDNDSILINKKPFIWKTWNAEGIECISNLLHPTEARFLAHEEIAAEYGITCSFLNAYQLRSAIPCSWRRLIIAAKRPNRGETPNKSSRWKAYVCL